MDDAAKHPKTEPKTELRRRAEKERSLRTGGKKDLTPADKGNLLHELEVHQIELEMQNEELRQTRQELQVSRNLYADLFELAPVGYFVFDKQMQILQINIKGAQLLGQERELITGTRLTKYIVPESHDDFYRCFHSANKDVENNCEIEMIRRGGARFYALLTFRQESNSKTSTICRGTIIDISERKKAEQTKDEFIGMVSHELKTPLTVMIGALQTINEKELSRKDAGDLIQAALVSSNALAGIVENLLELARFHSSHLVLHKEPADLRKIAWKVVEQLKNMSNLHHLIVDIPENLPAVRVDPIRVERIFFNLVENAVKYSPKGGEVRISAERRDDKMAVSVSDHGPGISADDQKKLFQSFEQLGMQNRRAMQGVGLGLKVCRSLVEAHGGQIWVESQSGFGTSFMFTL